MRRILSGAECNTRVAEIFDTSFINIDTTLYRSGISILKLIQKGLIPIFVLIEETGETDTDRTDLENTIVSVRFFKEIRSSEN